MKLRVWWLINIFRLIIFSVLSIIIFTRKVDGAGMVQTSSTRMISFVVLVILFVVIAVIQLGLRFFVKKIK